MIILKIMKAYNGNWEFVKPCGDQLNNNQTPIKLPKLNLKILQSCGEGYHGHRCELKHLLLPLTLNQFLT